VWLVCTVHVGLDAAGRDTLGQDNLSVLDAPIAE